MNVSGGNILSNIWQEPLLRSVYLELYKAFISKVRASDSKDDETIGEFFRRRGCPDTANDLVSALIHGIYAGDIDELSVTSVFPTLVLWEHRFGSLFGYIKWRILNYFDFTSPLPEACDYQQHEFMYYYAKDILSRMSGSDKFMSASIYTLQGGLQTLSTALTESLRKNPRIKLVTEATIDHIGPASPTADKSKVTRRIERK